MTTPLHAIGQLGQSLWYDNMRRGLLTGGGFAQLIRDGIVGCTSNPAIFAQAIGKSSDYDDAIKRLAARGIREPKQLYEHLAIEDIQRAADLFRPVFESSQGVDGFVSLEVSPHLAHDTQGTIAEAVRLRHAVDRPNVMIKVPATPAGFAAITALITQGVNINVTLLFAVDAYEQVAHAYMAGLEERHASGREVKSVASVASFFVSRIDTLVDEMISRPGGLLDPPFPPLPRGGDPPLPPRIRGGVRGGEEQKDRLRALLGQVAVANAYIAYSKYLELEASPRWEKLALSGARPQRLLWGSTSTKNPAYPKTKYVDALIAADTVNTIPPETVQAILESPADKKWEPFTIRWQQNLAWARSILQKLDLAGISLKSVTDQLLREAVKKFADPFDQLLAALQAKLGT
jgi:transaldolase